MNFLLKLLFNVKWYASEIALNCHSFKWLLEVQDMETQGEWHNLVYFFEQLVTLLKPVSMLVIISF